MNSVQNEADHGPEEHNLEGSEASSIDSADREKDGAPQGPTRISGSEDDADDVDEAVQLNGASFAKFPKQDDDDGDAGSGELEQVVTPTKAQAPSLDRSFSTPDDTPSIQDSSISSPGRYVRSRGPNHPLRPFDHRFQSRLSISPQTSPRATSPAFLSPRSRQSSVASQILTGSSDVEEQSPPWDVVRWTRLRKLSGPIFSEIGRRNYGRPTCIAVAGLIALGTSKGLILIFDTQQELKATIGLGTKAIESGSITAIALAADHSTVAGGHADGSIFTWEIAKPAKPFLHLIPLDLKQLNVSPGDGHIKDVSILHLGFLGTRHTALVSADDRGMAFSHLASRGMGPLSRIVHSKRILGRYPETAPPTARPRKPSSVLAFSPLPLGNLESPTDSMGLVAMLTPYLLVIVSTTPIAQTQHKASRPKELAAHGAMSAALAWYPAMTSADVSPDGKENAKLAYCWLNVLIILELGVAEDVEGEGLPELRFKPRRKWKAGESIVAMQWLNRNVLAIVTITQQLLIFEDDTMRITDSSDMINKHMFHTDLFSQQLAQLVEKLDEEDNSMHGVVADAFYMSFKAYKGRLFLLGHNDICIGALANWADRLLALMEHGDFIAAIRLATSFYTGDAEKATVGLPSGDTARHALVRDKLIEMMSASLKYGFGKHPGTARNRISGTQLRELAEACFVACMSLEDIEFLFEEVYRWYEEGKQTSTFFEILEIYISNQEIRTVPPAILKVLVSYFVDKGDNVLLEELLCRLSPETMDIDRVTSLCKQHGLYDALFYVWAQALGDYTSILKEILEESHPKSDSGPDSPKPDPGPSMKAFSYMSYALTGRIYPTGEAQDNDKALRAKAEVYHLLFSGIHEAPHRHETFPYLRAALDLSASSFMSMLNEAFEDSFLNETPEQTNGAYVPSNLSDEQRFGLSLNRQYVLTILLEILIAPEYDLDDVIYLDMFIARNLPKFPQFILLSGSLLHRVFVELCDFPNEDMADDCQLSVEYLLSVYQPADLLSLMPLLHKARFFRVIKSIYRAEREYGLLLKTCLEDADSPGDIFECIAECLKPGSRLSQKQTSQVREVMTQNLGSLVAAGVSRTASIIDQYAPDLHDLVIRHLEQDDYERYRYLRQILDSEQEGAEPSSHARPSHEAFVELYIRLLCDFDRGHVGEYVDGLRSGDLRLAEVLPALESSGIIDAAVVLVAREGKVRDAMDRLVAHLRTLEVALTGLLEGAESAPDAANADEAAADLADSLEKYVRVGIWLCRSQTQAHAAQAASARPAVVKRKSRPSIQDQEDELLPHELLWLDLLDAAVRITRSAGDVLGDQGAGASVDGDAEPTTPTATHPHPHPAAPFDAPRLQTRLRNLVQEAFTALLAATTPTAAERPPPGAHAPAPAAGGRAHPAFLRVLRAFLARAAAASPSLAHLRRVLGTVFAAYAHEAALLALAHRLLEKDLFGHVEDVGARRRRGWRPLGQVCGGCGARVWGPGVGAAEWDAWAATQERAAETARATAAGSEGADSGAGSRSKGKGRAVESSAGPDKQARAADGPDDAAKGGIVVFSCRHLFHRRCLAEMAAKRDGENRAEGRGAGHDDQRVGPAYRCPLEVDAVAEVS